MDVVVPASIGVVGERETILQGGGNVAIGAETPPAPRYQNILLIIRTPCKLAGVHTVE